MGRAPPPALHGVGLRLREMIVKSLLICTGISIAMTYIMLLYEMKNSGIIKTAIELNSGIIKTAIELKSGIIKTAIELKSGIIKTAIEFQMKVINIIVEMIEWKLEVWNKERMNEMAL